MSFVRKKDKNKYPNRMTEENRRKQKFAIWAYYEKEDNEKNNVDIKKISRKKGGEK